jgi:site-specific recombinase XerD
LLKAAKIENFRWHDLRHSFASSLVQSGVDLNTVRELMTHADMKMTLRYAHLAPESKLNAVQVLNRRTKGDKIIGRIRKASA